jgi:5,10-methylenetetrahydromethanopterin reductase
MTIPFDIGVLQLSMEPVHETAAMAKACEDAGFNTFWIAEAYPWWRKHSFEARSSTAILAVIASQTKRIQLGWGIISPYTRHPVQIAMEARVMQDLAGDRFLLGLGASKIFMKEIGEGEGEKVGPATVMRESIDVIRGVLKGDKFEYQGKVFAASVPALKSDAHASRKVPPVYVAGTGPAMQKLGGSLGDGLLTASITTPAFVRYSKKNMEEGAAKAGRDASKLILGCVIVGSIGRDSKKGKEGAREQAAMYLANLLASRLKSCNRLRMPWKKADAKPPRRPSAMNCCARSVLSRARPTSAFRRSKNTVPRAALTSCLRSGETIARDRRNCSVTRYYHI